MKRAGIWIVTAILFLTSAAFAAGLTAEEVSVGDIVSYMSNDEKDSYFKVAALNSTDAYDCAIRQNDAGVAMAYYLVPKDEADAVRYILLKGSALPASLLPANYRYSVESMGAAVDFTDTIETEIRGRSAFAFSYINEYYDAQRDPAPDGSNAVNVFQQVFVVYTDIDGTHTACMHIVCEYADGGRYISPDEIETYVTGYTDLFTISEG